MSGRHVVGADESICHGLRASVARIIRGNIIARVSRPRLALLNIVVAIVGVALLIYTVQRAGGWGVDRRWRCRASAGGSLSSCCLARFAWLCRTRAWMVCANDPQLRFSDAFGAWLVADAMGNLTPLGVLASEPTKILMVRTKISTVTSVASVTIENIFLHGVGPRRAARRHVAVPAACERAARTRAHFGESSSRASRLPLSSASGRRAPGRRSCRDLPRSSRRSPAAPTRPAEAIREVEAQIYAVPQWPIGRIAHVGALGSCVSCRRGRRSLGRPAIARSGYHPCRSVPPRKRRTVRHRGLQVRPVPARDRRSGLRRRRRVSSACHPRPASRSPSSGAPHHRPQRDRAGQVGPLITDVNHGGHETRSNLQVGSTMQLAHRTIEPISQRHLSMLHSTAWITINELTERIIGCAIEVHRCTRARTARECLQAARCASSSAYNRSPFEREWTPAAGQYRDVASIGEYRSDPDRRRTPWSSRSRVSIADRTCLAAPRS